VIATETELIYLDQDKNIVSRTNNERTFSLVFDHLTPAEEKMFSDVAKPNKTHIGDLLIDTWIQQNNIEPYIARQTRDNWTTFKRLVNDKPLSSCTRDDGRKLVAHFREHGNKTRTIHKKVGYLAAAINLAIKEGKLTFNPFSSIVPKEKDGIERAVLSEQDMAKVRDHLSELAPHDQLLWKLLACTGMRLAEPFEIREEYEENGVRYVIVGTKNAQSRRRVPIPPALFDVLPAKIEGPLFPDGPETTAKRLRYFLKRLGIMYDSGKGTGDPRKLIHSLRHRAKDRLRAAGCQLDIQYHLLGHEELTVAKGYGHGYPMDVLLPWVEKIGY